MNSQKLRLDLDIAYFQTMSKIVQFGRTIQSNGPPVLAKIMPLHSLAQEVIS